MNRSKRRGLPAPRLSLWLGAERRFSPLAKRISLVSTLLCAATVATADVTLKFRQGVNGYSETDDLHIAIPADFMGTGHREAQFATDPQDPYWVWDIEDTTDQGLVVAASQVTRFGWGDEIGLLRFGDLFGDRSDQIPPRAEIIAANLYLYPDNPQAAVVIDHKPGDTANLHRVLVDWDESVRWNTFGPSPGPNMGEDYLAQISTSTGPTGGDLAVDVTESLQAWSQDPSGNKGWAFIPVGSQDIISPAGSALTNVTKVTVDLVIDTASRGELVVTLRHGDYTSLLVDRLEATCVTEYGYQSGSQMDDIDVTIDDDATQDIHSAQVSVEPLTGTYRPDSYCFDMPLCTGGGTGGLCGQPADGDWVLTVTDEWGLTAGTELVSWAIHLSDGVHPDEVYESSPALVVPTRHRGTRWTSAIWSSENANVLLRPQLEVIFRSLATLDPSSVEALPATGTIGVSVRIPPSSNLSGPVTVYVASDDVSVAQVLNSPLVYAQGGSIFQQLQLSIGAAGSATLSLTNDAGFGNSSLPVTVSTFPIELAPQSLYRGVGDPDEGLDVSIPYGSNASSAVNVTVSSSDPGVADLVGGVGGSLALNFAPGASNTQTVTVDIGASGTATITATDAGGIIGGATASVAVSDDPPVSYEINLKPYIQFGDPAPEETTDQFLVVWQTITVAEQGPDADRFEVEYRKLGDASWSSVSTLSVDEVGSSSRLNHVATITGLDFDAEYEYRVTHLRNGVELEQGIYEGTVRTRKTDHLLFTAVGNLGNGNSSTLASASRVAGVDPDVHFFLGDQLYYMGEYEHFRPRIGNIFGEAMSSIPTVLVVGNHEGLTLNAQPLFDHSYVPTNGLEGQADGRTFSFDIGSVHFVVVDSTAGRDSELAAWISADLAATSKPWKILLTHELGLTLDPYGTDRQYREDVREFVLKPAVEGGANLYIGGASHSFQRYLPITAVHVETPESPVEWAPCSWGAGTTLLYSGGGDWYRAAPGPIPNILEPPMQLYQPMVGMTIFAVHGDTLYATIGDLYGMSSNSVAINNCQNPADCICPVCGDGTREDPEECDDSNTSDGDGCSDDCQIEYARALFGVAEGGTVSITLEGVLVSESTTPGQTAAAILRALADSINAEDSLGGVYAFVQNQQIITNGEITEFDVQDPSLSLAPPKVPLGSGWAVWTLMGLLAMAAIRSLLHRRPGVC